MGSGAFTAASVARTASVETVGDRGAYLSLTPSSEYARVPSNGTLELDFAGGGGGGLNQNGEGLNQDGITQFLDLFEIKNQGTQDTAVFIDDNGEAITGSEFSISGYPDGNLNTKLQNNNILATTNSAGFFVSEDNVGGYVATPKDITDVDVAPGNRSSFGSGRALVLTPGDSLSIGWYIDTREKTADTTSVTTEDGQVDATVALWGFSSEFEV